MDGLRADFIRDDSLKFWEVIGSGGFGQIYRAKHTKWGTDVAIKLLLYNDGRSDSSLEREARMMVQGGNPNVVRIFGLYEGRVGEPGPSRIGLVMEYMERGSLADLLQTLDGPPPWPLTFRIIHQIALGMNFLHHLSPPLLHLDLKPRNVLLDDSLNAKITDFGLSRLARSFSNSIRNKDEGEGGTLSYMPPEALESVNYKPTFTSDIYSYGVLLWSIITGKEPYTNAPSTLVRFRIPLGDRPDLSLIDSSKAAVLNDIVELMKMCWAQDPKQRPSFLDCVNETGRTYEMHKLEVKDAVRDVQNQLDDRDQMMASSLKSLHITPPPQSGVRSQIASCLTGPPPKQETAGSPATESNKREAFYCSPPDAARHMKTPQRQTSTPGGVHISMSNVSAVQIGNFNKMYISQNRQRHQTAPSSVNRSHSHSETSQKKE